MSREGEAKLADSLMFGGARKMRMPEGKDEVVGVAGRTLTEVCGEREGREKAAEEWMEFDVDDVEEALEWLGTWWILRIDEIEEEVDLRPRRPPDECL